MWFRRKGSPRSCAPAAHTIAVPQTHTHVRALSSFLSHSRTQRTLLRSRDRESGIGRAQKSTFTHLYVSAGAWCTGPYPSTLASSMLSPSRESAFVFPVISRRAAPRRATPRDVRTCVSTCERAVCLHARRQRHAVPHTQLTRRLGGPGRVSSRARATASRFTYIRYDTSEPQGRQVAHKTKETRERRYGESKTVTGRDRGRAREAKNRPGKKGREREA